MGGGVIVLDTHILIWWVSGSNRLTEAQQAAIDEAGQNIGVSVITCWEIAKLVERDRLLLDRPVSAWLATALSYPGVRLLELTLEIAVASTQLPGTFHRDPADQIIVATARETGSRLVTSDQKILAYEHVGTVW